MTPGQLRVFVAVAVAERQHVTRAAETLHLAQSAASAAIAALEICHGVPLFHRVGRHIELTEAGRAFLPEARAVLRRIEMAERVLTDLGEGGAALLVADHRLAILVAQDDRDARGEALAGLPPDTRSRAALPDGQR